MTYNPADYAAVMKEAQAKPKKDLEKYYVEDKSKKHKSCCENIAIFFVSVVLIAYVFFAAGVIGASVAEDNIEEAIGETLVTIEDEICPLINESYESTELFGTSIKYPDKNRITCD